MPLFAHEILSKFQAFEVKHGYEDKFVRCSCMVSANYMEVFCNHKEITGFLTLKKLVKLYSPNLIFFECFLNYPKFEENACF